MLLQNIIFWKEDPNANFQDLGFEIQTGNLDNVFLRDIEMMGEREYIILQIQFDIVNSQEAKSEIGWVDVTSKDIEKIMNLAKKLAVKHFLGSKQKKESLKYLGSYQMIITGTEKDYWTKSEIDIHKFKINADGSERQFQFGEFESENNLSILNKDLFKSKFIRGDLLGNLRLKTTLYGLGNNISDEFHQIPKTYLLNINMDPRAINDKDLESKQYKQYRLSINTVISNFGELLAYLAKLTDLYNDEYKNIQSKSNVIRDKALKLQIKINELLTKRSDKKTTQDDDIYDSLPGAHGLEEKLLLKASRHFSYLTEINQVLAQTNYLRHEASMNVEKMISTLGLTQIKYHGETDKETSSLGLELKQFLTSINYYFQNLKVELDHSQTTIRNTVDILKTFLESEQRIVSQQSSEAINWIVIVFAGLGLADALGNFVIFWLEGGSPYEAMFWFFIILITLIMIIVTLYIWYFKRPHYLQRL